MSKMLLHLCFFWGDWRPGKIWNTHEEDGHSFWMGKILAGRDSTSEPNNISNIILMGKDSAPTVKTSRRRFCKDFEAFVKSS